MLNSDFFSFFCMAYDAFFIMAPLHVASHAILMIGSLKSRLNRTFNRRLNRVAFLTNRVSMAGRRMVMTGTAVFICFSHMHVHFVRERNGYVEVFQQVNDNRIRGYFFIADSGARASLKARIRYCRCFAGMAIVASDTRKWPGCNGLVFWSAMGCCADKENDRR